MPRPVHFEIHADDLDRAQAFYTALFGWSFQPFGENYLLIATGEEGTPGINGGMFKRIGGLDPSQPTPVIAWVCTVDVDDIDTYVGRALDAGAAMAMARQTIPGVGHYAYCRDTEGNIFGMMQRDAAAH
jgi:predicted enzyme related to lactoylglutathione lyase